MFFFDVMKVDFFGWFGLEDGEKLGVWVVEDFMIIFFEKKMSRVYVVFLVERLKVVYNILFFKFEIID